MPRKKIKWLTWKWWRTPSLPKELGGEYAIKESPLWRAFLAAILILIFWFALIKKSPDDEVLGYGRDPMPQGVVEDVYIRDIVP